MKTQKQLRDWVSLFLRIALGTVFIYHGYFKVFGPGVALGTHWNPQMNVILQALVSWGELLCGIGFLFGFLVRTASVGTIVIMIGAIALVTGKNGFNLMKGGFEYNFVLIFMCLALLLCLEQKPKN